MLTTWMYFHSLQINFEKYNDEKTMLVEAQTEIGKT